MVSDLLSSVADGVADAAGAVMEGRTYASAGLLPEGRSYPRRGDYGGYSRPYRANDDSMGAFSFDSWDRNGGGCCCGGGYGGGVDGSIFSDGTLFALLAGAALAFYILYTAINNAAGTGRRRREALLNGGKPAKDVDSFDFEGALWQGLEEFEEKIDRLADGQDDGHNSWISDLYNTFKGQFGDDVDNELKDEDMDGIEPPLLDETWGLGSRTKANTTVDDAVPLKEDVRKKRDTEDEDIKVEAEDEEKCRIDMWRCMSKVIEGGLHYLDKPEGIMGFAKKTMFKVAFHGGVGNVWSGLMSIPEARKMKKCMNAHEECISYQVLRREVAFNLDPSDPDYEMLLKINQEKADKLRKGQKERMIINPDFVQSLDESNGETEHDE